jgi:hypothetical protein
MIEIPIHARTTPGNSGPGSPPSPNPRLNNACAIRFAPTRLRPEIQSPARRHPPQSNLRLNNARAIRHAPTKSRPEIQALAR